MRTFSIGQRVVVVNCEETDFTNPADYNGRFGVVADTYEPWGGGTMYVVKFDDDGMTSNFEYYEIEEATAMSLDKVDKALAKHDEVAAHVEKRVRQAKKSETLEEAKARILAMKLDEKDVPIVERVFALWRDEKMPRPEKTRVSKKLVMETWAAWQKLEHERKVAKVIASKSERCWIVTNHVTLATLEAALMYEDVISLDVETTGLDIYNDRIVGIAGYFPASDVDFYVPFGHIDPSDKDAFVECGVKHGFDVAIERYRLPSQLPKEDVMAFYRKCVTKRHVWHNFDYDAHLSLSDNVDPGPPWWDTFKAMKVLNEHETTYRLKDLYAKYVSGDESITFEDLFPDGTIFDKPIDLSGIYAGGDGRKTYALYEFQKRYIDTIDNLRTVWYEIEQPLLYVDPMTERQGIHVDLAWLRRLSEEFTPLLEQAERDVREAYNLAETFNFDSHADIAYLVYDVVGVDPNFPKRFKKNPRSTAKEVLDALCDEEPKLAPLLKYRMLAKLLGTYVEKIPHAIEPATGKMHFSLDSQGTETGRYSSYEYCSAKYSRTGDVKKGMNIQNVPARTKEGVRVRMAFVPQEGWLFVGSDLSQIEPRVLAHKLYVQFGDDSLKRLYDAGEDIYTRKAMEVFGFPLENCVDGAYDPTGTFKPRKALKDGVLAYLYGQQPPAFARKQGLPLETAYAFFESMEREIVGLPLLRAHILDNLLTRGKIAFSETLDGRKRRYPTYRDDYYTLKKLEAKCYEDGLEVYRKGGPRGRTDEERAEIAARIERLKTDALTDDDKEAITRIGLYFRNDDRKDEFWTLRKNVNAVQRAAVNHEIQGTAADILKRNIIRIFWMCRENGWRFLTSIHDETWLELPKADVTPQALDMVEEAMTKTVKLAVPLKSDSVIQPRWMDEYKRDEWDFESGRPVAREAMEQ